MLAIATGAQAGGLYDNDDNDDRSDEHQPMMIGKSPGTYQQIRMMTTSCDTQANGITGNNGYYTATARTLPVAAPLVRAVGKRNLVLGFARNSARFAWTREARFVHGEQYANWGRARDAHISCTRVGALNSCEATATPCY